MLSSLWVRDQSVTFMMTQLVRGLEATQGIIQELQVITPITPLPHSSPPQAASHYTHHTIASS